MMNETFKVASLINCDNINVSGINSYETDPMWHHSEMGCILIHILQDMYKFKYCGISKKINIFSESHQVSCQTVKETQLRFTGEHYGLYITYFHESVSYVVRGTESYTTSERRSAVYPSTNDSIDFYVRPMTLQLNILPVAHPIHAILTWRVGFILKQHEFGGFRSFYSEPFTRPVWNCLYGMGLMMALTFYFANWTEKRLVGGKGEFSFWYEVLIVIGAYCQHAPPLDVILSSRRTVYVSFFLLTFLVYTYYTSNLLSHLVSKKEKHMDLDDLADSDYDCLVLENMEQTIEVKVASYAKNLMQKKFSKVEVVNISTGLQAVRNHSAALLSDYVTVYTPIMNTFYNKEMCQLMQIDLYSDIKKFFFTSLDFPYKEELKIGLLRIREVGILRKITEFGWSFSPLMCSAKPQMHIIKIEHISSPLMALAFCYGVSIIILLFERLYYCRYKVYPYVN